MPQVWDFAGGWGWFPQSVLKANLLGLQPCWERTVSCSWEHPQAFVWCLVDSRLVLLVFVLLQPGKCEFDSLLPSSPLTPVGLSPVEAKTLCSSVSLRGPRRRSHSGSLTIISCPFTDSVGKESACSAGDKGDTGSVPGSGRSPEKEIATHSWFLLEKFHGLKSLASYSSKGSQRAGQD